MRPRRGWCRAEGEAVPPRGAFVRESQVWTPPCVSPAQARPVRSAAQGGRTGCSWAGRREAEAGRNYGGEACGRGSGLRLPGSRAARPTDAGRGGPRGGALWGPRVREALSALGGRASERRGQRAVHHASPSDRTAGVRKPTAATPGAGVSAVAPASFRHQRSQAGEEPSERTPWEECVQRRIHAFLPTKAS